MTTTLIESAKNGQLDVIRQLVIDGYDVNQRCSPDGATALYWSACNGHLSTCDWLIRHGADVNQSVEKSGSIPLHGAADRGHVDCALLLIIKGSCIDIKTRSNRDTPLHLAAYRGHVAVCRVLLQNGARADIVNAQGCTALDEAQIQNHYDIFQLLCKHRQRKRFLLNQRKSETCLLNPTVGRQSNKLITEVLSRSSEWDKTDSYESSSTNRFLSGENIASETEDEKHSKKLDETIRSLESCPEICLVLNESKTNDLNSISSQNTPENSFSVNMSSKTDDVMQELVTKFNQLVAYSSDLQVQLTIREDEKDRLSKENQSLIERLEFCKKFAEAVEESNRARMESERRALRAERELIGLQQRIEVLVSLNLMNEKRLLLAENNESCSYTRQSAFESNYELQPRGPGSE